MSSVYKQANKNLIRKSEKLFMAPTERDKRNIIIERAKKMARFEKNSL